MADTDVLLINKGLSKISASRISRIDPARTPLENYMAINYPSWRKYELTRRRWVFAMVDDYQLTLNLTLEGVRRCYVYNLPNDCLRPIRGKHTEWVQRGRQIYSSCSTLFIDYIRNVPEAEFDPLFEEVLACKVAFESAEYVTQSTSKKQSAQQDYDVAVQTASQCNAFVIGPEDIEANDAAFDWVNARYQGN